MGMQWQGIKGTNTARSEASAASLCIHMGECIDGLKGTGIKGKDAERPLEAEELAGYRSTLAKARWPVDRVAPELAYGVSALAQHNTNQAGGINVHHAKELNRLVQRLNVSNNDGCVRIYARWLDFHRLVCLTYFDASLLEWCVARVRGSCLP